MQKAFVEHFSALSSPEDNLYRATNATIDPDNLAGSLREMKRLFEKAGIDETAK